MSCLVHSLTTMAGVRSRRVIVKADKIGHVRATDSFETGVDAATSTRVEDHGFQRAYVKSVGLSPPPPAFQEHNIGLSPPTPPHETSSEDTFMETPPSVFSVLKENQRDNNCTVIWMGCFVFVVIVLVSVGVFWISTTNTPTHGFLDGATWSMEGMVQTNTSVVRAGWTVPPDVVEITNSYEKLYGYRTVVDGEKETCWEVPLITEVVERIDTVCTPTIVSYTKELEVYSHTEEIVYDDGRIEEKDFYDKIPAKPIYKDVCEQVPIYATVHTQETNCKMEQITHQEPVWQTYWVYRVYEWVDTRTIRQDGHGDIQLNVDIAMGERMVNEKWTYRLHFVGEDNKWQRAMAVSKDVYLKYLHVSKGELVEIP